MLSEKYPWFRELETEANYGREAINDLAVAPPNEDIQVVELTGEPGDVILMDSRCLHCASSNCRAEPRLMVSLVVERRKNTLRRFTRLVSPQNPATPPVVPCPPRTLLGLMTYSPLAVGLLNGQYRRGQAPEGSSPWAIQLNFEEGLSERGEQVIEKLIDIAAARDATPSQIAMAWILAHPEVTAPIIGPDLPEHVVDAVAALDINLTEEERRSLDDLSQWAAPSKYLS